MKLAINLFRVESWFKEDIAPVIDMIELADRKGIDTVNVSEHIVIGTRDLGDYPYAASQEERAQLWDENTSFWEPTILMAWIGARTKKIRLSTFILQPGLRPAVLLAKQISTLDVLCGGRLDLGIGVGWQKVEYDAEGIDWDTRFGRMMETVEACRKLWTQAPASYAGKHIFFDEIYCRPFPVQPKGPAFLFGVAPTERNIERMAQYADGWMPLAPLSVVQAGVKKIRERMKQLGRDPSRFRVVFSIGAAYGGGKLDVKASFADVAKLAEAGITDINIMIKEFCSGPDEYERVLDEYMRHARP